MSTTTDRIEKKILLKAPRSRVWRALTDYKEFERWFGVRFDRPFKPGEKMQGKIIGTSVDAEIAKGQKQFADIPFEITIGRIEPERLFSFRWHPAAVDRNHDYSQEPTTLVEFTLEDAPGGVLLTVTESGFDQIPLARRVQAFQMNEQGWEMVVKLIEKYLVQA
ncbi:MAG TPA: SRPBCC family protein [Candidatus Angelobacter sp.]